MSARCTGDTEACRRWCRTRAARRASAPPRGDNSDTRPGISLLEDKVLDERPSTAILVAVSKAFVIVKLYGICDQIRILIMSLQVY